MKIIGPFTLHEHLTDNPEYELQFEWDEAFDSRGLKITQIFQDETGGAAVTIWMNRTEAQQLHKYLFGCVNYRPLPEELQ